MLNTSQDDVLVKDPPGAHLQRLHIPFLHDVLIRTHYHTPRTIQCFCFNGISCARPYNMWHNRRLPYLVITTDIGVHSRHQHSSYIILRASSAKISASLIAAFGRLIQRSASNLDGSRLPGARITNKALGLPFMVTSQRLYLLKLFQAPPSFSSLAMFGRRSRAGPAFSLFHSSPFSLLTSLTKAPEDTPTSSDHKKLKALSVPHDFLLALHTIHRSNKLASSASAFYCSVECFSFICCSFNCFFIPFSCAFSFCLNCCLCLLCRALCAILSLFVFLQYKRRCMVLSNPINRFPSILRLRLSFCVPFYCVLSTLRLQ